MIHYGAFEMLLKELNAEQLYELRTCVNAEFNHRRQLNPLGYVLTVEEHQLMKSGNLIKTIQSLRARLYLGLKEAKDFAESYYPREK